MRLWRQAPGRHAAVLFCMGYGVTAASLRLPAGILGPRQPPCGSCGRHCRLLPLRLGLPGPSSSTRTRLSHRWRAFIFGAPSGFCGDAAPPAILTTCHFSPVPCMRSRMHTCTHSALSRGRAPPVPGASRHMLYGPASVLRSSLGDSARPGTVKHQWGRGHAPLRTDVCNATVRKVPGILPERAGLRIARLRVVKTLLGVAGEPPTLIRCLTGVIAPSTGSGLPLIFPLRPSSTGRSASALSSPLDFLPGVERGGSRGFENIGPSLDGAAIPVTGCHTTTPLGSCCQAPESNGGMRAGTRIATLATPAVSFALVRGGPPAVARTRARHPLNAARPHTGSLCGSNEPGGGNPGISEPKGGGACRMLDTPGRATDYPGGTTGPRARAGPRPGTKDVWGLAVAPAVRACAGRPP